MVDKKFKELKLNGMHTPIQTENITEIKADSL
jgi:hypothetical protein